ncbi:heterokaryon incompatibility protein-domain-containing protein [Xylaria curta]|nr:heterokaryon incompatibility protein-domain-containing protein [Xylaria curta]
MKIQVNRCPFYVTPNLHDGLKRLRKQNEPVPLWVDALCINQHNKEELSEQVALMTAIYGRAESVAAWLGPESDGSELAFKLIQPLYHNQGSVSNIIADWRWRDHFTAVMNLFERDFWNRLWIVQEIINAQTVFAYCGDFTVPWEVFRHVSAIFKLHEADIRHHFPQGTTLGILHPRADKGILPENLRAELPPNYNASIREVYTNVVDLLLHTTHRIDIICDAIYYPVHTSTSFIPSTAALGLSHEFSAASDEKAIFEFGDPQQRTKLKVASIYIDTLEIRGTAVGTFCTLEDYLMAFLHWQAKLFAWLTAKEVDSEVRKQKDEAFCRTLALGKVPVTQGTSTWLEICYYIFTSLISERLPFINLNDHLKAYKNPIEGILPKDRRIILHNNCASKMQGRCFFTTKNGLVGMGSGFMNAGDIICVPLGCKTPIMLRLEGDNEYRLVGDAYVDGYMNG